MRFIALWSCSAMVACADGSALPPGAQCASDGECNDGLVCDFNHCISPEGNHLQLMARLVPPVDTGLLPQQAPTVSTEAGPAVLVQLLPSALVQGVVTKRGEPTVTNVPGELEVRSVDVISGLEHRFIALSSDGINEDALFGFDLVVLPGRSYEGVFRPDDPLVPDERFVLTDADIASGRFDLELPAKSEYVVVSGRVRRAATEQPILAAKILVLDEQNEVLASTKTDDIRGVFKADVAPDVHRVRVKVEAPDGENFGDFVTDLVTVKVDEEIIVDVPGSASLLPAVAEVTVTDPEGNPAPDVTVTMQGRVAGGVVRRTQVTDKRGIAQVEVLPTQYECLVVVPADRSYGSWHGWLELSEVSNAKVSGAIQLKARAPLAVHVRDAFGVDVSAGQVTLERRVERGDGEALSFVATPRTVDIGALGDLEEMLDPGVWDLVIAPDPETGAPNTFVPAVEVGKDGLALEVNLPTPGLLHLTVADPNEKFLSDVSVELWLPPGDDGEPRLLVRGATNERGFVDLLVPHENSGSAHLTVDNR